MTTSTQSTSTAAQLVKDLRRLEMGADVVRPVGRRAVNDSAR